MKLKLSTRRVIVDTPSRPILRNAIFQFNMKNGQPIYLEDVNMTPAWDNMAAMEKLRTWMGVRVQVGHRSLDVLSLGRLTPTPFSKNEMDAASGLCRALWKCLNIFRASWHNSTLRSSLARKSVLRHNIRRENSRRKRPGG